MNEYIFFDRFVIVIVGLCLHVYVWKEFLMDCNTETGHVYWFIVL